MSHGYHEGQPNYSPAQVLHDGCDECSYRRENVWTAINYLDAASFARAWARAAAYERGQLDDACETELPLLRALWAIQCQLERRGVPIGEIPTSDRVPGLAVSL